MYTAGTFVAWWGGGGVSRWTDLSRHLFIVIFLFSLTLTAKVKYDLAFLKDPSFSIPPGLSGAVVFASGVSQFHEALLT